jgi:hypothetical protein
MSVIQNNLLLTGGDEGYNLTRSLRFRASAGGYLSKTYSVDGNKNTWTWSSWVKRGSLGVGQRIFCTSLSVGSDTGLGDFYFSSSDKLNFFQYDGGTTYTNVVTTQVFRDPSAWYHIVLVYDDTQATASNRVKFYVNGIQVTAFDTASYPTQNFVGFFNDNRPHSIGRYNGSGSSYYYDGYLTEINFVDGQALTPSSFGETDTITGVWKPKRYAGTYGTNGFYLPFTDNSALTTSSNVGLGRDYSGNGNYWTTNNISITAGVTYDSMTDVPTLTSATAANFCVMNPLDASSTTFSNANLSVSVTNSVRGAFGVSSGKWYWEVTTGTTGTQWMVGISTVNTALTAAGVIDANTYAYYAVSGNKYNNGASSSYGTSFFTPSGIVVGVALDMDAGTLAFYNAGVSQGVAYSGLTGKTFAPWLGTGASPVSANFNFGQRPFTYTPPTGFVALNTFNLPTSTIVKGNTVMDATLYTGNGGYQEITNAGGMKSDFLWIKSRSSAQNNVLLDSVRGDNKYLVSNSTAAEVVSGGPEVLFQTSGFAVGGSAQFGANGTTYVGWQWQAGQGTTSSNTSGSITSTVSVNASAGFGVVTYTTPATNTFTVGHGLGVAPSLIFVKSRNQVYNWDVYHASLGATGRLILNTTSAFITTSGPWANTAPTSTVFSSSGNGVYYNTGDTLVAYCWTPIAGFSAFGSYTGNGSTDGPFVYTGFRPRFILYKASNNSTNWVMLDTARDPYNVAGNYLFPNSSSAEGNVPIFDIVSNGFKVRTAGGGTNGSGDNIVYMAFAENPFRNALAR